MTTRLCRRGHSLIVLAEGLISNIIWGVSYRAGGRGGRGRDCSIWGWWIRGCNRGWGLGGLAGG